MSLRAVLLAAGLLAVALTLGLGLGVLTSAPPAVRAPDTRTASPRDGASTPRQPEPAVSRDLLRYAEEARPEPAPAERLEPIGPIVTLPLAPPPPAERLVGFVRRGGLVQAALALPGSGTVVLGAGDRLDGYSVVSVDEEAGVVLRLPDGRQTTLLPPAS